MFFFLSRCKLFYKLKIQWNKDFSSFLKNISMTSLSFIFNSSPYFSNFSNISIIIIFWILKFGRSKKLLRMHSTCQNDAKKISIKQNHQSVENGENLRADCVDVSMAKIMSRCNKKKSDQASRNKNKSGKNCTSQRMKVRSACSSSTSSATSILEFNFKATRQLRFRKSDSSVHKTANKTLKPRASSVSIIRLKPNRNGQPSPALCENNSEVYRKCLVSCLRDARIDIEADRDRANLKKVLEDLLRTMRCYALGPQDELKCGKQLVESLDLNESRLNFLHASPSQNSSTTHLKLPCFYRENLNKVAAEVSRFDPFCKKKCQKMFTKKKSNT